MTTQEIQNLTSKVESIQQQLDELSDSVGEFHAIATKRDSDDTVMHIDFKNELEKINTILTAVLAQTTRTNGRVTRNERIILISFVIVVTLLVANGSELLKVIGILI